MAVHGRRLPQDDDDYISPEEQAELDEAERDFLEGRTMSHEEAKAYLGEIVEKIVAGTFDFADYPELAPASRPAGVRRRA
ncbi:hypothetical protein [Azospirillum sp.]|uniref:hypothetical protein n=1 Tax=Azospirillum sp. TaxID=34012 RepID=UPI002D33BE51|nr:hypothetical protein [Azospirillum sp.]HYD66425.1 hypothetical protein [Azospirillum sp.]